MPRRTAVVHVGLPQGGGDFLPGALTAHADALAGVGVAGPFATPDELRRAAVEMTRSHRSSGFRRQDVEGTWAEICRRARKSRGDVVLGTADLAACTREQVDLLVDGLAGFDVHAVITARDPGSALLAAWVDGIASGRPEPFASFRDRLMDPVRRDAGAQEFWATHDLDLVSDRWSAALRSPDRVHVVVVPPDRDAAPAVWSALGAIVGFPADTLPLAPPFGMPSDRPHATGAVLARATNRAAGLPDAEAPLLGLPDDLRTELVELGERWAKHLADRGYDVRGDGDDLVPRPPATSTGPDELGPEQWLAITAGALADALEEVARLRQRHEALVERTSRLEHKRKKLRRRLQEARA